VLFALICSGVAVAYGIWLTVWLLGRPEGNERMKEIAKAVQEGAAAYLRRQYMTIAAVSIVPFLLLGFYNKLGWGTAIGFLVGAILSAGAGFIGMNVAVRANVRTAEAAGVVLERVLWVRPKGLRAALYGAGVHPNCIHPIQIQRNAAVHLKVTPRILGDGRF